MKTIITEQSNITSWRSIMSCTNNTKSSMLYIRNQKEVEGEKKDWYIKHLANVAILSRVLRQLNSTATWRVVSDKPERVECWGFFVLGFTLLCRASSHCNTSCGWYSSFTAVCGGRNGKIESGRKHGRKNHCWVCDQWQRWLTVQSEHNIFVWYLSFLGCFINCGWCPHLNVVLIYFHLRCGI